jgi:hypothetical protein
MAKQRVRAQEYKSFAEYREAFFPEAEKRRSEKKKEAQVGNEIAKAAIDQAKKDLGIKK